MADEDMQNPDAQEQDDDETVSSPLPDTEAGDQEAPMTQDAPAEEDKEDEA